MNRHRVARRRKLGLLSETGVLSGESACPVPPPSNCGFAGSEADRLTPPSPSSPHLMSPYFPQEILDEIVDVIAGGSYPLTPPTRRILQDCSLVAKAWVRRSQKHLFAYVSLTPENLPSWCRINAQNPNLLNYHVRTLEIKQDDAADTLKLDPDSMEAARPYLNFPNLEVLGLSQWDNLAVFSLPRTFGHYSTPSLRSLSIIDSISNGDVLLELASLFPCVDEFVIDRAFTTDKQLAKTFSFPDSMRWRTLRMISIDNSMVELLDAIANLPLRCQVLDISYELLDDPRPIMRLIHACSTTLKSMRLEQTYSGNSVPSLCTFPRSHPVRDRRAMSWNYTLASPRT